MPDRKVLIVQQILPEYRRPLFEGIGMKKGIDLTVMHSGSFATTGAHFFEEKVVKVYNLWKFNIQSISLFSLHKYEVIILPMDLTGIGNVLAYFFRGKAKLYFWGHGLGKNRIQNWLRKLLLKKSSGVILYDHIAAEKLSPLVRGQDVHVAPNTVLVANASFDRNLDRVTFLYVGRVQERKKINELLIAFSNVVESLGDVVQIEIVGEGDEQLRDLAKILGIQNRVVFHGKVVEEEELKPIFQRSLAYVSPGHVGLGVLHSFAYGVPVVTSENADHAPEFANLKHMKTGLTYDGSLDELQRVLIRLSQSKRLSWELGENAFNHYSNFRTMKGMVDVFKKVILSE